VDWEEGCIDIKQGLNVGGYAREGRGGEKELETLMADGLGGSQGRFAP
jgi:hypothetical protein